MMTQEMNSFTGSHSPDLCRARRGLSYSPTRRNCPLVPGTRLPDTGFAAVARPATRWED